MNLFNPTLAVQLVDKGDIFFKNYNAFGRSFLDVLHLIFNSLFYVFLVVMAVVSFLYLITTLYVIIRKKEQYVELPVDVKSLPFVTVQIPTRNELAAIRCAELCLQFDYPKDKYEILIGDDSSQADVSEEIAAFASKHHETVRVLKRKSNEGYKAGNLNNMLPHSKGEYLVLFDSDFTPSADFLKRVIAPMLHDRTVAGVQGRWKFLNAQQNMVSLLGAAIVASVHHVALPFVNKRRKISILCGSAEAVRKDVLVKLGGWQHGSMTEDVEYSLRMLKHGYKIQYLPSLECGSEVPYTPTDLYRQQMRWAHGVIGAARDHVKEMFSSRIISAEDKFLVSYVFSGYLFSVAFFAVLVFGILSIITHNPEPINFAKFFAETGRNILLTSGLLVTGGYAMAKSTSMKKIVPMILSSLSYGLIVTYYINVGIFRVLTGKPMQWFLLNKQGNQRT